MQAEGIAVRVPRMCGSGERCFSEGNMPYASAQGDNTNREIWPLSTRVGWMPVEDVREEAKKKGGGPHCIGATLQGGEKDEEAKR